MASERYRILCLFPMPARSHATVFFSLTDALADRGHELVIATIFPKKDTRPNVRYIDWSSVEKPWNEAQGLITQMVKHGMKKGIKQMAETIELIFELEVKHPEIQALLKNYNQEKFDLIISEVGVPYWFAFADIYKAPLIAISSSDPNKPEHEAVGNVVHYLAAPIRWSAIDASNFKQRLIAVYMDFYVNFWFRVYFNWETIGKKYFGIEHKSMNHYKARIDMLFINVHPATGIIRPLVPKTIPLGFLHVKPAGPLPEELEKYLNESQHGVVYCSLGTQVRTSSLDKQMQTLIEAFKRIKYDVIFKSDTEKIEGTSSNVRVEKWLPQNDLLAHKSIKLFITQAGQHSMEEAIYHGVPLLALPFFGDQPLNGKRIADKGIGEFLFLAKTTPEQLSATIVKIIENQWYRDNIENLSKIVQDQPMTSLDKAVWWTEYTVRHKGANHLTYPGLKVPFYQYFYFDVGAAYFGIFITAVIGLYLITRLISNVFFN